MAKISKRGRKAPPRARRGPVAAAAGGGERFELAMRAINEGVYDWDVASGTIYYSEAVYSVLHMPRSVKTPGGWRKRIHPDDLAAYDAAIIAHFKKKTRRFECDYRYRARDRTWRWARQHGVAIRDKRGRVVRMIGSTGDITELKRIEQALKENEQRDSLAMQAATEGIYDWDLQTGTLYASDRAKAFFGLKGHALTPAAWNRLIHREDFPAYRKATIEYFKGRRKTFEYEYRIHKATGGYIWVLDRGVAVRNAAGKVVRMVGSTSDITQRKLAEIELRRARDEATEALERQTATAEILSVIAGAPSDVRPVLEAIVKRAAKLCEAQHAVFYRLHADGYRPEAAHNVGKEYLAYRNLNPIPVSSKQVMGRVALTRKPVHVLDVLADPDYKGAAAQKLADYRTVLGVPVIREGKLLGNLAVFRTEVRAFSKQQTALLQTFADQAVIAIENVRLFNETKEALEQQRATSDVLASISGSMADTQPVFERIVQNLRRLFGTRFAVLQILRGDTVEMPAVDGDPGFERLRERYPRPLDDSTVGGLAMLTKKTVQYAPVLDNPATPRATIRFAKDFGFNSVLFTPMIHEGKVIGAIGAAHPEPKPFDERQVALIKTFADQAVIAIQNARLFSETREALERQTATAEILRVIGGSMTDTQPVFDAIVKNGGSLFKESRVSLWLIEGDQVHTRASTGESAGSMPIDRGSGIGACVLDGRVIHLPDLEEATQQYPRLRQLGLKFGYHSGIYAPLLRDGRAIGGISVVRREAGACNEKEVALLNTFADQAVIAIENVRLFKELEARNGDLSEALEQQTATAEVLRAISSSPNDIQPIFETLVRAAARFCGAPDVAIMPLDGNVLRGGAACGPFAEIVVRELGSYQALQIPVTRASVSGRAVLERRAIHVHDLAAESEDEYPNGRAMQRQFGHRTMVAAPLLREGVPIGVIALFRREVRPFIESQLSLLQIFADQAVIAIENVRLFNKTKEALERQTATAEILKVIASSPSDVQPVFDAIVQSSMRLLKGATAHVTRLEGGSLHLAAYSRTDAAGAAALNQLYPLAVAGTVAAEVLEKRSPLIVSDVESDLRLGDVIRNTSRARGVRSFILVPLVSNAASIGTLVVNRREAGAFSEHEIELLQTFADQAVIAIENVRLFNETKEALERQTAIGEILRVISNSPADVQPVLDAVAERAARICDARVVDIVLRDGDMQRVAATFGDLGRPLGMAVPLNRETVMGRSIVDGKPVQVADLQTAEGEFALGRELAIRYGHRSILAVPLMREGRALGTILVRRAEVRPFDEKHVALLQTFADQAAIAIQNVRLFNETKEALEQQTATAEILKVIASSPSNVQPVLEAIVSSAARLVESCNANIVMRDGYRLQRLAIAGPRAQGFDLQKLDKEFPIAMDTADSPVAMAIRESRTIEIPDTGAGDVSDRVRAFGRITQAASMVIVPLLREGSGIGAIVLTTQQRGFKLEKRQLALMKTFADQAVIAIENVRLFNETKEALERQTATAEILKVIASSPSDVQPVFDTIVKSARQLIGGHSCVVTRIVGDSLHLAAFTAEDESGAEAIKAFYPRPASAGNFGKTIRARAPLCIDDLETDPASGPEARELGRKRGYRSVLVVPMIREDDVTGLIHVTRQAPGPFSEHQINLVKTFADQASIAIENVRLFNETKEALERQTATAEILKVIASSPSDVQPVFDAIAASARRLLDGGAANVTRRVGDQLELAAHTSTGQTADELLRKLFPAPITGQGHLGKAILTRAAVRIRDLQTDEAYSESFRARARERGLRSVVSVPMLREGEAIGVISVNRPVAGEFSDHQTNLLKTFADQAVIAIENVRLFNETKEALERQTATSEVLRVIGSSVTDIQPVFDIIAERAARLTGAEYGWVFRFDGEQIHVASAVGVNAEGMEAARRAFPMRPSGGSITARAIRDGKVVNVADVLAEDDAEYKTKEIATRAGYRATLSVPMIRDRQIVGAITASRAAVGKFSDKEVDLLRTFADQAVIAIENVRLFNETKEALERQTATAEILKVISSSPTDTQPVFEAIARSVVRLCDGLYTYLGLFDGRMIDFVAFHNVSPQALAIIKERFPSAPDPGSSTGRAILERAEIHIPDVMADAEYSFKDLAEADGYRAILAVPMLREGSPIGVIAVGRRTPFSRDQIELVKTFADQAVIAIENVRLFKELESRTEALTKSVGQLTALGEVGQAISSTLDLATVLQTIVSRAVQLTGVNGGTIYEFDERAGEFLLRAYENMPAELVELYRSKPIRLGEGVVGSAASTRAPVQVPDIQAGDYQSRYRDQLIRQGYRAILAVPLLREEQIIGALTVSRGEPGEFPPEIVELLKTFATQSAMAIQNARLFREIAEKGRQLELASLHKSNFLASMSHELRTPLNAILGFNEMILGQVYGEVPADMQEPLADIQTSGKHLLRLINNVLDLAKIEAGRMELSLQDYSVHDTVGSVHSTLRPLASEKGLEFLVNVPEDVPLAYGDSGRITQCLMNLAGNSIKFTKAGRVEIVVAEKDGLLTYRVMDTGIGIPPDKIASLFTEFKQTDATIASEYGGTGLGLSISKKFVEMHGGRIWIESELGKGSVFIIEVPLRVNAP